MPHDWLQHPAICDHHYKKKREDLQFLDKWEQRQPRVSLLLTFAV